MKCPLFRIPFTEEGAADRDEVDDCIKEECAWWNEHNNECSVISTGKVLNYMADYINAIKDKMPHEEQFRR